MTALTRRTFLAAGAGSLGAAASTARAQTPAWPTRPLRIIIPTAPGGSPDMVARLLGNKLTERLGQPVVVESIVQGVGLVGNQMVSRAAPDGSTFAMLTGGFTTQAGGDEDATVRSSPRFCIRDDSGCLSDVPAGRAKFADLKLRGPDRARQARARSRSTTRSSAAAASTICSASGSKTRQASNSSASHTAARSQPSLTSPAAGSAAMLDTATSAISRIRNGQMRALAVSSPERYPLMPDVPTMNETVPGVELMSWLGLATAPANTEADHRQAQCGGPTGARPARCQTVACRDRSAGRSRHAGRIPASHRIRDRVVL